MAVGRRSLSKGRRESMSIERSEGLDACGKLVSRYVGWVEVDGVLMTER